MLNERGKLSTKEHSHLSLNICQQLYELIKNNNAKVIHTFIPLGSEIDITNLINKLLDEGITIIAPKSLKGRKLKNLILKSLDELEEGIFKTKHPAGDNEYTGKIDVLIAPGLAFDKHNNRLGYGSGYYDIFLADNPSTLKVGICFPFQLVNQLPIDTHDIPVDVVIC